MRPSLFDVRALISNDARGTAASLDLLEMECGKLPLRIDLRAYAVVENGITISLDSLNRLCFIFPPFFPDPFIRSLCLSFLWIPQAPTSRIYRVLNLTI